MSRGLGDVYKRQGGMELTPAGIRKARTERRVRLEALKELKNAQNGEGSDD